MGRVVVLDNGHGGMIKGVYQTAGKRSPDFGKGILYEGVFNRDMVKRVAEKLDGLKVPYHILVPEESDVSLAARVQRVNELNAKNKIWLLSLHSNAGGGTGIEGFTTKGNTKSDAIADVLLKDIQTDFKNLKMRFDLTDGDLDKEENFYVLLHSKCPAVLMEILFMDNKNDYELLFDESFRDKMACVLANSIKKIYDENY